MMQTISYVAALAFVAATALRAEAQSRIIIDGLEVTQSVQHYKSSQYLRNPRDYGSDNSIPLIAGKTAYVRAYVRRLSGAAVPIVGTLTIERQQAGGWVPVANMESRQAVTPVVQPGYRTQRGDLGRTLNFLLPGPHIEGALRFTATARKQGTTAELAREQVTLPAALRRRLRVAIIAVGYRGPSENGGPVITAPPPSQAAARAVVAHTVAQFPVHDSAEVRIVGTHTISRPLLVGGAGVASARSASVLRCPDVWGDLLDRLHQIRRADGARRDWLYYGLLAEEIPRETGTTGCGREGLAAGQVSRPGTMTHELGHAANRRHVPGTPRGRNDCTGDNPDNSYPTYRKKPSGSYPRGSIGEYGLDTRTGTVHRPERVADIMTYCAPRWISPWLYSRLIDERAFEDQQSGRLVSEATTQQPLTAITAVVSSGGAVEDVSMMELTASAEPIGERLFGFGAELADASGRVLATVPVHATPLMARSQRTASGVAACPCIIEALLPPRSPGDRVRITHSARTLFESPGRVASGSVVGLQTGASRGGIALTWTGIEAHEEVWIRFSDDRGRTWAMLDVGIHPTRTYQITRARVPESSELVFEVFAPGPAETRRAISGSVRLPGN